MVKDLEFTVLSLGYKVLELGFFFPPRDWEGLMD